MPEFLETTVDKFTFRVATDRLYTALGVWAFWVQHEQNNRIRVGLTDYLQQSSGDVAFVSVRAVGTRLVTGEDLAELETIKVVLALPSPVGGTIVEVNQALDLTPEIINQDPYGNGWLAVIEPANWDADREKLLDPPAYFSAMRSQVEEELKK